MKKATKKIKGQSLTTGQKLLIKGGEEAKSNTRIVNVGNTIVDDLNGLIR